MISPETLRRFPLFGGLQPEMIKTIAMLGEEVSYEQGTWLFHEGSSADRLFLVLEGEVELSVGLPVGVNGNKPSRLDTRRTGDVIGWSALVPPHTYTLGGHARTDVVLAQIDGPGLRGLLDENPVAGYLLVSNLAVVVGERLVNLRTQLVSVTVT